MIKTIIFDLGKVIVPFEIERLEKLANHCDFSTEEIRPKLFASEAVKLYEIGKIDSKEFFTGIKSLLGLRISFGEFADIWNGIFDQHSLIPEEFIANLKQKYRLIILSDTNEMHFEFIKMNFPAVKLFDKCVLSYEIGFVKPSEEAFRNAVEFAKCKAKECLFIDDRQSNVDGAIAIGVNAICFSNFETLSFDLKKWEI
jgi:glucose-1-phosphatase